MKVFRGGACSTDFSERNKDGEKERRAKEGKNAIRRKWSFLPRYSVERAKPLPGDGNIYSRTFRHERTRILRVNGDLQRGEAVTRDFADSFNRSVYLLLSLYLSHKSTDMMGNTCVRLIVTKRASQTFRRNSISLMESLCLGVFIKRDRRHRRRTLYSCSSTSSKAHPGFCFSAFGRIGKLAGS